MTPYLYTSADGRTIERWFPMGQARKRVVEDGRVFRRDLRAEQCGHRSGDPWTDHESWAMGVHPLDREEAMRVAREGGVPTHYNEDGNPIITSASHQRKLMRLLGMHNKQSYY